MVDDQFERESRQYQRDLAAGRSEDRKPPARIAIYNRIGKQFFDEQDDAVKEDFEKHVNAAADIGPEEKKKRSATSTYSYEIVLTVDLRAIDSLPKSIRKMVERINHETGCSVVVLWGGRDPYDASRIFSRS